MKSMFDKTIRKEIVGRISSLHADSKAQWGKMNIFQMLKHCTQWEEMALGRRKYKQSFLGRIFGKMALKDFVKDDAPMKRNVPTVPEFRIKERTGDVESERQKWVSRIEEYAQFSNDNFTHPFFGRMNEEQIGYLAYKHTDHHLRQFNA
jgi:Protein of unknown function (DUF1569)